MWIAVLVIVTTPCFLKHRHMRTCHLTLQNVAYYRLRASEGSTQVRNNLYRAFAASVHEHKMIQVTFETCSVCKTCNWFHNFCSVQHCMHVSSRVIKPMHDQLMVVACCICACIACADKNLESMFSQELKRRGLDSVDDLGGWPGASEGEELSEFVLAGLATHVYRPKILFLLSCNEQITVWWRAPSAS